MDSKPDIVRAWCAQRVGCPYIYGGTGQPCTPSYREARMKQYPAYAEKIQRNCPRLMGKATVCSGCKWCDPETGVGKLAYDCAQLSRRAMEAVGISLVSGANPQWEKTHWQQHGKIDEFFPDDCVCLVFRRDEDHMGHVGVYQGDGWVIHAKGHDYGVVRQQLDEVKFTHYGIPYGLYMEEPIVKYPTLKRGSQGIDVVTLQKYLILLNYLPPIGSNGKPTDDGIFGQKTEDAVKTFQQDYGLKKDGVCGPLTWEALEKATGYDVNKDPDSSNESIQHSPDDVVISRADWDILTGIIEKYKTIS